MKRLHSFGYTCIYIWCIYVHVFCLHINVCIYIYSLLILYDLFCIFITKTGFTPFCPIMISSNDSFQQLLFSKPSDLHLLRLYGCLFSGIVVGHPWHLWFLQLALDKPSWPPRCSSHNSSAKLRDSWRRTLRHSLVVLDLTRVWIALFDGLQWSEDLQIDAG